MILTEKNIWFTAVSVSFMHTYCILHFAAFLFLNNFMQFCFVQ